MARHTRNVLRLDGKDNVAFVQNAVVLQIVHERGRRRHRVRREEHRRARHPVRRLGFQLAQQPVEIGLVFARLLGKQACTRDPGHHYKTNQGRHEHRNPCALQNFQHVGSEECLLKEEKRHDHERHMP